MHHETSFLGRHKELLLLGSCIATALCLSIRCNPVMAAPCDPKVKPTTFEQFKNCTYREPGTGIWIVDGDTPVDSETKLRVFYETIVSTPVDEKVDPKVQGRYSGGLILDSPNGVDSVWPNGKQCGITYCVSTQSTGQNYNRVVGAMQAATQSWSSTAGVRHIHDQTQDANCTATNQNVDFDVDHRPYRVPISQ